MPRKGRSGFVSSTSGSRRPAKAFVGPKPLLRPSMTKIGMAKLEAMRKTPTAKVARMYHDRAVSYFSNAKGTTQFMKECLEQFQADGRKTKILFNVPQLTGTTQTQVFEVEPTLVDTPSPDVSSQGKVYYKNYRVNCRRSKYIKELMKEQGSVISKMSALPGGLGNSDYWVQRQNLYGISKSGFNGKGVLDPLFDGIGVLGNTTQLDWTSEDWRALLSQQFDLHSIYSQRDAAKTSEAQVISNITLPVVQTCHYLTIQNLNRYFSTNVIIYVLRNKKTRGFPGTSYWLGNQADPESPDPDKMPSQYFFELGQNNTEGGEKYTYECSVHPRSTPFMSNEWKDNFELVSVETMELAREDTLKISLRRDMNGFDLGKAVASYPPLADALTSGKYSQPNRANASYHAFQGDYCFQIMFHGTPETTMYSKPADSENYDNTFTGLPPAALKLTFEKEIVFRTSTPRVLKTEANITVRQSSRTLSNYETLTYQNYSKSTGPKPAADTAGFWIPVRTNESTETSGSLGDA